MGRITPYSVGYYSEETESTADRQKRLKKAKNERFYNQALSTLTTIPSVLGTAFDGINTFNEGELNQWNLNSKVLNQDGAVTKLFDYRVGRRNPGFFNKFFFNKFKNATRTLPQRIKIRKNVLSNDFINWWGSKMAEHNNPDVAAAFKSYIGEDTLFNRLNQGSFDEAHVIGFYSSDEYRVLLDEGIVSNEGINAWMEDISNFKEGDVSGLKGYVTQLADKMNLKVDEMHYILQRDGGYKLLPNVDSSQLTDITPMHPTDKYIGPLKDNLIDMDPSEWSEFNAVSNNLFVQDGLEGIQVSEDGIVSIPDEFFGSEEFYNMPQEIQNTLENMNKAGENVVHWVDSLTAEYKDIYGGPGSFSENVEIFNQEWGDDFGEYALSLHDNENLGYKDKIIRASDIKKAQSFSSESGTPLTDSEITELEGLNSIELKDHLNNKFGTDWRKVTPTLQTNIEGVDIEASPIPFEDTTPIKDVTDNPLYTKTEKTGGYLKDLKPVDVGMRTPMGEGGPPASSMDVYKLGVESTWKNRPFFSLTESSKLGTGLTVAGGLHTLATSDSDLQKTMAAASLTAEAVSLGLAGTAAQSATAAWIPYVGPVIAAANLAVGMITSNQQANKRSEARAEHFQDVKEEREDTHLRYMARRFA